MKHIKNFEKFNFKKKKSKFEYKGGDAKYFKRVKGEGDWVEIPQKEYRTALGIKDRYDAETSKK